VSNRHLKNSICIFHANHRFRNVHKIVLALLTDKCKCYDIFHYASDKFKNGPEMCIYAEISRFKNGCRLFLCYSFYEQHSHLEKAKNYKLFSK
jgi:hypothetical protein